MCRIVDPCGSNHTTWWFFIFEMTISGFGTSSSFAVFVVTTTSWSLAFVSQQRTEQQPQDPRAVTVRRDPRAISDPLFLGTIFLLLFHRFLGGFLEDAPEFRPASQVCELRLVADDRGVEAGALRPGQVVERFVGLLEAVG